MNLSDHQRRVWAFAGHLARKNWFYVVGIVSLNLVAVLFEGSTLGGLYLVAQMIFVGKAFDFQSLGSVGSYLLDIKESVGRDTFFLLLVGVITLSQVLRSLLQFGGIVITAYLRTRVIYDLHTRIFQQIIKISYAMISRQHAGDLWNHVKLTKSLESILATGNQIFTLTFMVLAYLGLLFWMSWKVTLIAVVALFILSMSVNFLIRRVGEISRKMMEIGVRLSKRTIEFLLALRELKYFGRENYAIGKVYDDMSEGVLYTRKSAILGSSVKPILDTVSTLGMAAFLIIAFYLIGGEFKGEIPELLFFFYVLYRLIPQVAPLNQQRLALVNAWPAAERLVEFLREDNKEYTIDGTRPISKIEHGITFETVGLRYLTEERPAVRDATFDIPKGKMVALVGESGAGKSSLIDLVLRLYDPTSGKILVDGQDLKDLKLEDWRSRFAVVSQDVFLFHSSIRENIAFGKLDAGDDEIFRAARAAHAHDFISDLEKGYETIIGDRGFRLSGGQRQRIALARALIRDPDILILDEATNELDSESEKIILDAMEEFRAQRTVLAVAHRLSTIRSADKILVLDQGRIIEEGSHDDLVSANGTYARLWRIQSGDLGAFEH